MNAKLWLHATSLVTKNRCPAWPCPVCRQGHLALRKKSLEYYETKASLDGHADSNWEVGWIEYRFTAWTHCTNSECRAKVAIAGDGSVIESEDWESGETVHDELFTTQFWSQMPSLIEFPDKCPADIVSALEASFILHAIEPSASGARIRVAVERLMDHAGVPAVETTKKGKKLRLALGERLKLFEANDCRFSNHLTAITWLGNNASHASSLGKTDVITALEIVEHILHEVVGSRSKRIAEQSKMLMDKFKRP